MFYCPYCNADVKQDETYCFSCGQDLPADLNDRIKKQKTFNKFWIIPLFTLVILLISMTTYYVVLDSRQTKAIEQYDIGEDLMLTQDYKQAKTSFEEALQLQPNFSQAEIALNFINKAILIMDQLDNIENLINKSEYNEALVLMGESENSLKNLQGNAVTPLVNQIVEKEDLIKVAQLKEELADNPDIYNLKTYLWVAEEIRNDSAEEIASDIREKIVDYTFSMANEQLNNNQFNDAQIILEDGLKYVPDSEKLKSLNTTIEKEKIAFETELQQRIELAINLAAEEDEVNNKSAINLDHVNIKKEDDDKLVVSGEVSSVATIPVSSILIEYTIATKDNPELITNKVFVYPDKLFPDEVGKFEFTHYDIKEKQELDVNVTQIRWYTD